MATEEKNMVPGDRQSMKVGFVPSADGWIGTERSFTRWRSTKWIGCDGCRLTMEDQLTKYEGSSRSTEESTIDEKDRRIEATWVAVTKLAEIEARGENDWGFESKPSRGLKKGSAACRWMEWNVSMIDAMERSERGLFVIQDRAIQERPGCNEGWWKNNTAVMSVKDRHGCNECHTRRRIRL